MNKLLLSTVIIIATTIHIGFTQDLKEKDVPAVVRNSFTKKYPGAKKVTWEKEKGNFEANWGGRTGEDNSAVFTPSAEFVELVEAIPVSQLPSAVASFVIKHYKGVKISEAGKVTDAAGVRMFEAEIKGKDLIFDEQGIFIRED
ncbi:MAG: hypothetical protein M3N30_01100 [Bacteroidota bacterium]|nr:hypothetical protein [Bacteroidota bacterium]